MKFILFTGVLISFLNSLPAHAAGSANPFTQWTLECPNGSEAMHGAPYSVSSRTIVWNFSAKTDADTSITTILAPFTDPSTHYTTLKTIDTVKVTPIFETGCFNNCSAQQLSLRVDFTVSGMSGGFGTSADYAEVTLPTGHIAPGTAVTLTNTWVSSMNDCDRGDCPIDTSGTETLQCTVQSIQF